MFLSHITHKLAIGQIQNLLHHSYSIHTGETVTVVDSDIFRLHFYL
jgi:hypothetical protein